MACDTPGFQRRVDRRHGGPPVHIVARQQAERASRLERKRIAAAAAAAVPADMLAADAPAAGPASDLIRPAPVAAVPLIAPTLPPAENDNLPAVAALELTRARRSPWRALERIAAVLLLVPFVGAGVALLMPASAPPPAITAPTPVAGLPIRSAHIIERRIREMTPVPRYSQPGPALPGSISLAAISLPQSAPDVPMSLPVIVPLEPTLPNLALALALPAIEAPVVDAPVVPSPLLPAPLTAEPAPPAIAAIPADAPAQCTAATPETVPVERPARDVFGAALAAAALKQTTQFVVYDARYTRIAYPGGDVSSLQGVCTDVIIRAYRALGIDLQQIVHESRIGSGDTSIDHRRTETLRKFFAIFGENLPVSTFVEDFQPGDIVTYYRPQNRTSTAHIAVVSDVIAPSGRPMIIHNRGLGVQLEDALFVDKITGHYRYAGPVDAPVAVAMSSVRTGALPMRAAGSPFARPVPAVTLIPGRAPAKSPAAAKLAQRFSAAVVRPATSLRN